MLRRENALETYGIFRIIYTLYGQFAKIYLICFITFEGNANKYQSFCGNWFGVFSIIHARNWFDTTSKPKFKIQYIWPYVGNLMPMNNNNTHMPFSRSKHNAVQSFRVDFKHFHIIHSSYRFFFSICIMEIKHNFIHLLSKCMFVSWKQFHWKHSE